jgi:hypothetical protein
MNESDKIKKVDDSVNTAAAICPDNVFEPTVREKFLSVLVKQTRFKADSVAIQGETAIVQKLRLRVQHALTTKLLSRNITGRFHHERSLLDKEVSYPDVVATADAPNRWAIARAALLNSLKEPETHFDTVKGGIFLPHETTYWELHGCSGCNGAGKNKCTQCQGKGKDTCTSCSGTGRVHCNNGCVSGKTNCYICNGSGHVSRFEVRTDPVSVWTGDHTEYTSVTRNVEIRQPCSSCNFGKVTCSRCGGSSVINCGRCGATGRISCSGCHGLGHISCSPCEGSGKVGKSACVDVHLEPIYSVVLPHESDASATLILEKEGPVGVGQLAEMQPPVVFEDTEEPKGIAVEYPGTFSIKRLHARSNEKDYSLVAYGPDLRWLTMDGIVEDFLQRDLDLLRSTLAAARTESAFSTRYHALLESLKHVIESEVNADLVDAHLEGRISDHVGAGSIVSNEYAEQLRDAKVSALSLIHKRIALAYWWKPFVSASVIGTAVWAFSTSIYGAIAAALFAVGGYILYARKVRTILTIAFDDRAKAVRSSRAAGKYGKLRGARFVVTLPAFLVVLAITRFLPSHGPFGGIMSPLNSQIKNEKSVGQTKVIQQISTVNTALEMRRQGNFARAREIAHKGSDAGDLESRGLYSFMLLVNEGITPPPQNDRLRQSKEATTLAAQVLEKNPGDPWALSTKAFSVLFGFGGPVNTTEGFRLLNLAADAGGPVALHILGLYYINGSPPVKKDSKIAEKYFTLAMAGGNINSAWPLGLMHWNGDGIPVNRAKAVELWKQCAKIGNKNCEGGVQGHP